MKTNKLYILAVVLALSALAIGVSGIANAQGVFNKYGPVNGVQCSTGATYQNTACTASALPAAGVPGALQYQALSGGGFAGLGSALVASDGGLVLGGATGGSQGPGTINAPALYINGAPVGTSSGAVSSVALSEASTTPIFTITGSPVTAAGTLTETLKTQTANTLFVGPSSGSAAQPTFRALVTADFPTTSVTAGSCTFCSLTVDATGRLTAQSSGTPPAGANPSAAVGLTVTNGSATTFMRSDGAPALSQAIAPTWTNLHIFSLASTTGTPTVAIGTGSGSNQGALLVGNTNASNYNANPTPADAPHMLELVNDNGPDQGFRIITYGASTFGPDIHFEKARGTLASPAALQLNDTGLSIGMRGYNGSVMTGSTIGIEGEAAENWDSTHFGSWIDFQLVPTGGVSGGNRVSLFQLRSSSTANTPTFVGVTTGNSGLIYMPVVDSAGTRFGYFGHASSSDASMTYESDSALNLVANNGTDRLTISTGDTLAFNSVFSIANNGTFSLGSTLSGTSAGVITIAAPSSGNTLGLFTSGTTLQALVINGVTSGTASILFSADNAAKAGYVGTAGSFNQLVSGSVDGDTVLRSSTNILLSANNGASGQIALSANGNTVFATPTSGTTVAVNAVSGGASATFTGAGTVPLEISELSAPPNNVLPAFVGIGNGSLTGGSSINGDLVLAARTSNANWIDFVTGGVSGGGGSVIGHITGDGGMVWGSATGGSQGTGKINATGLYVNGVPVVTSGSGTVNKLAAAEISGTASTCTIAYNGGGVASCAQNGSGQWTITFTTSYFTTNAACTATGQNASVANNLTIISSPSPASVNVLMATSTTGTLLSSAVFNVICIGT